MDQTIDEIETHIDRTRDRLGSNLRELEDRVDAVMDWREHYRARPYLFLGAAFAGGVFAANALRTTTREPETRPSSTLRAVAGLTAPVHTQAAELWTNIERALFGVASMRVKEFIAELVPGFDENYRRVEER